MAQVRQLAQFEIEETDDAYRLHIGGDDGQTVVFEATPDQMEDIVQAFIDLADDEDDDDEVAGNA